MSSSVKDSCHDHLEHDHPDQSATAKILLEEERVLCQCKDDANDHLQKKEMQSLVENSIKLSLNDGEDDRVDNKSDDSTSDSGDSSTMVDVETEVICKKCNCSKLVPLKINMYSPYTVRGLKKDTVYEYCTCGLTKNQPFCDKSHIGTSHKPIEFTLDRNQSMWILCGCRYSQRPPHCDGSHTNLPFNPKHTPCKCPSSELSEKW